MALRLRPVRRADLDTLERWWADPEAQGRHNWFGFSADGDVRRRFEQDGMLGADHGNLLVELEDGTPAGDVSYYAVQHGPNPGSRAFNVGIALLPEHRGRGHGAEAQRQLAAYLFAHTRVERLEASTDVENLAEQRPWSGPASPARASCARPSSATAASTTWSSTAACAATDRHRDRSHLSGRARTDQGDRAVTATSHDWVQQGTVRAELEAAEARTLAPWAAKAAASAGRSQPEPEDPVRTCWMRDLDRIIFSRAMLRAHGKTQSFIPAFSGEGPAAGRQGGPYIGDHYVTRATHMQQTARIAATIAQALSLNVPLASAIATGHDLGHACFGHGGEAALQRVAPGGFDHARQGARLLTLLEPRNLTAEVLDGIARHSWKHEPPSTLEGLCARLADRIAYLTADLTDALRAGVLSGVDQVPAGVRRVLGEQPADMIGVLVEDVIRHSRGQPRVVQGEACAEAMAVLRSFMFEHVYLRPEAERQTERATRLLTGLFAYYLEHPDTMPMGASLADDPVEQQAVDAIAGMTDRYALAAWKAAFAPEAV